MAGLGFFRLDHQLNQRNNLFFRGDLDALFDTNPNGIVGGNTLPTVARVFHRRTYSVALGETAVLGPDLLNNARVQFFPTGLSDHAIHAYPANGTQYQVPISTGGTFTTGTSQSALLLNHQYQVSETLSKVAGRHVIRIGADVLSAHTGGNSKKFGGPIYLGQFVYNVCTQSGITAKALPT